MDITSIIFGLYFENILNAIKWCLGGGRAMKALLCWMAVIVFSFGTLLNFGYELIEKEEAKQLAIYNELLNDKREHRERREQELKLQVNAVLNRKRDDEQ